MCTWSGFFVIGGKHAYYRARRVLTNTHTLAVPPSAAAICAGNIEGVKEADRRNGKGIE